MVWWQKISAVVDLAVEEVEICDGGSLLLSLLLLAAALVVVAEATGKR